MFQNPQIRQMNQLKMFRQNPFGRITLHFSFESSESYRCFYYLQDSNSIFRAAGTTSEKVSARTVFREFQQGLGL